MTNKILMIRDLYKYGGYSDLNGVDFDLLKGQSAVMYGNKGAGKSVLFKCIMGYLKPDDGRIIVHGRSIYEELTFLKQIISYMPREISLFEEMRIYKFLKYLSKYYFGADLNRLDQIINDLELDEDIKIKNLSLSKKRLVQFAAVLIGSPVLILLDDPVLNLDANDKELLIKRLKTERDTGVSLFISTNTPLLYDGLADLLVHMHLGRIDSVEDYNIAKNSVKVQQFDNYTGILV